MHLIRIIAVLSVLAITGCSTVAPVYQASFENTQKLKDGSSNQIAVDSFKAANKEVNNLTVRAGSFASPTNGSYSEYLQKALEQELYDANRLSKNSDVIVGGTLLENEIDASGFSVGVAHVKAEFTVKENDTLKYKKTHSADIQWPSHFVGAIAIPRAIQEYPKVFTQLLHNLYADDEFMEAIK